ncbi:MAG: DUF2500 domain-containing protein [Deltaproteobacteria bacterium]|nr:DUF2500 domain-containing protein [Deltaproteobacteria bacterium]
MDKVVLGLIIVFGILILVMLLKGFAKWKRDSSLPETASEAIAISKRYKVKTRDADNERVNSALSSYHVTFQFIATNERREFRVRESDYGLIAEGDQGVLWHQGDIFKRFERQ